MVTTYFILLAAVFNLAIGLFVLRANYKNLLHINFAIMSLLISVWVFLNFLLQQHPTTFLLKSILAIGPYLILSAYIWAYLLTNTQLSKNFLLVIISLFLSTIVALSLLIFYGHLIIQEIIDPITVKVGKLYYLYSSYMGILLTSFIAYLVYIFKRSDPEKRQQIRYVLIGLFSFITIVLIVSLILPLMGYTRLSMLDSPSSIIFVFFCSLAILKYRLFNIKVITTELLVAVLWVILFVRVLTSRQPTETSVNIVVLLLTIFFGILVIRSVKDEIRRRQEIQKLTAQLKKANIRLQELDRLKSEFLSVASHELNSPMAIILGYLHMILWEGFGRVDKNARQYLEKVYFKAELLAKLVSDLLNVSRIEEGRLRLEIQPVDSLAILEDLCEDYSRQAEGKGLTFVFHRPSRPFPNVSADPDKLKEVISNLLSNAVKFTKSGGVEVTVGQNNGEVVFNIKDTGIGIPKEAQSHIGEKFYRTDNSWVREVGGTGLGLYLVGQYLRLMNGRLWFESEEGKGSVFHFSLPVAKPGEKIHHVEEAQITERPLYARSRISPEQIKERLNHQGERGGQ